MGKKRRGDGRPVDIQKNNGKKNIPSLLLIYTATYNLFSLVTHPRPISHPSKCSFPFYPALPHPLRNEGPKNESIIERLSIRLSGLDAAV